MSKYNTIIRQINPEKYIAEGCDFFISGSDASSIIQNCITKLPPSGGQIFIGRGEYKLNSTINVDRPLAIRGAGTETTEYNLHLTRLVASDDLSGPNIIITGSKSRGKNLDDSNRKFMQGFQISDISLIGNGNQNNSNDCIRISPSKKVSFSDGHIERVGIRNAGRSGIRVAGSKNIKHVHIDKVMVRHCKEDGISIQKGRRYWLTNVYSYACRSGIYTGPNSKDLTITFPHVRKNRKDGIVLNSPSFQIFGGRIINNKGNGISIYRGFGRIFGTDILNNDFIGIMIKNEKNKKNSFVQIIGNCIGNIGSSGSYGLQYSDSSDSSGKWTDLFKRFSYSVKNAGLASTLDSTKQFIINETSGSNQNSGTGIKINPGVKEVKLNSNVIVNNDENIIDKGIRTHINGMGTNNGNPNNSGDWRGHGKEGVEVFDEDNNDLYKYILGTWRVL